MPLTSAGGGNFNVNKEVAAAAKAAIEKRYGADYLFVFNPANPEADLPKGSTGTEYMVMWTAVLEGPDGLGDFDVAYFAGPQDFARYFGFDGNNDMAKLDAFFDKRVASDPDFAKAVQGGLTKPRFPQLLWTARVVDGEPRRARRMEHLPPHQRQATPGQQIRNAGPDPDRVRRPRALRLRTTKRRCRRATSASVRCSQKVKNEMNETPTAPDRQRFHSRVLGASFTFTDSP